MPLGGPAVDVFQHHNGVVHNHTHTHGDAPQGHHIQGQVKDVHQYEHREDAHRHGHSDGGGGAPPAQKEEHHHGGQNHAHLDVLHGGVHRHVNVVRGGVQHGVDHRSVALLELGHLGHHRVGGRHLVGPGLLGHLKHHTGDAVGFGHSLRVAGFQHHIGHLRQADGAPGLERNNHIGHVLHRLELGVGGDGEGLGAVSQVAAGEQEVFGGENLGDVGVGQPEAGGPGGVHLHGDLLLHAAGDGHLGHAVDALQGGGHRVLGQGLDRGQILSLEGDHGRGHQVADVDVDDNGVHGPIGEGQPVKLLPQLGGGDIQVGALHIGDLELAHPIGGSGLHPLHPGHRHNGRLQGAGDQLLHVGGAGAVVVAHHQGGGGLHVGQEGQLEPGGKDHAEDGDHNHRHQSGNLVPDTEFRDTAHWLQPSPETTRTASPSDR